jgi:FKBP12-rapamycin complex-associated protein
MTDEATGLVIGGSALPTVKILDDLDTPGEAHIVELCERGIIYEKLGEIFALVREGLRPPSSTRSTGTSTLTPALNCAANLVEALGDLALPYITDLIDEMFRAGLSNDLIQCLHSIAQCVPAQQNRIEDRMLQEVSLCLAGIRDVYDPQASFRASALQARALQNVRNSYTTHDRVHASADSGTETSQVRINMSDSPETVRALALSLQTLASFGNESHNVWHGCPLLPFVQDVAAQYLSHPSSEVRRAAALTCCVLLIPHGSNQKDRIGSYSGIIIEDVLERLLRAAVSDPSPVVRLCVVRSLDSRYNSFLCQSHHLQELSLAREAATRPLALPAGLLIIPSILPVLRRLQNDLIVELQCGVDTGRGREEATRLLVVFLRAKSLQRLVHPVLPSLVSALPLDGAAPPRLASASLEALGELAQATGVALQPWVKEVVPHVLEIIQDRAVLASRGRVFELLGRLQGLPAT